MTAEEVENRITQKAMPGLAPMIPFYRGFLSLDVDDPTFATLNPEGCRANGPGDWGPTGDFIQSRCVWNFREMARQTQESDRTDRWVITNRTTYYCSLNFLADGKTYCYDHGVSQFLTLRLLIARFGD